MFFHSCYVTLKSLQTDCQSETVCLTDRQTDRSESLHGETKPCVFLLLSLKRCVVITSPANLFNFWLRWLTKHFNQPGATDHAGVLTQEEVLYKIEEKKTTTEGSKATRDETIPPLVGTPLKERKIWWEIDAD